VKAPLGAFTDLGLADEAGRAQVALRLQGLERVVGLARLEQDLSAQHLFLRRDVDAVGEAEEPPVLTGDGGVEDVLRLEMEPGDGGGGSLRAGGNEQEG